MVGEPFNKRSVPCAFGIKIGLYFQQGLTILSAPAFCLFCYITDNILRFIAKT